VLCRSRGGSLREARLLEVVIERFEGETDWENIDGCLVDVSVEESQ